MAKAPPSYDGKSELRRSLPVGTPVFASVAVFSVIVNLLMLTGPMFMLQVYDRVLGSRSVETLTALFILVAFLFLLMGILDLARNRITQRVAARFQSKMEGRVFTASLHDGAISHNESAATASGMRDLDLVQRFLGSPVLLALFDLPWVPIFLAAIYIFHPVLGVVATIGGIVLVISMIVNRIMTRFPLQNASSASARAQRMADLYRDQGEVIRAMGMRGATFLRWHKERGEAQEHAVRGADLSSGFTIFSKTFRMFLQSAILAAGAWLVLQQKITPGIMIASSIMMGRALAPIEQVVGRWGEVQSAQDGWGRLSQLLERYPPDREPTALPRPQATIDVRQLSVVPPGQSAPTLRGVSFALEAGQAMGVIGSSGAGKSTLARALTGAWSIAGGAIRIGGATLDQYHPDVLGNLIGYLPQQVTLFDGTIAENISRLAANPEPGRVVRAAQEADAHQMILELPDGYDTPVSQTVGRLSGGQIQRIGLARALYPNPVLLILDEPNSNLDSQGSEALNQAIRRIKARKGTVIIMAHRPAAIMECDMLLVLDGGYRRAFGPRDEILQKTIRNSADIRKAQDTGKTGGVT